MTFNFFVVDSLTKVLTTEGQREQDTEKLERLKNSLLNLTRRVETRSKRLEFGDLRGYPRPILENYQAIDQYNIQNVGALAHVLSNS